MISPANGPIRLFVLGDARIETPVATIEPRAEIVFATALYLIMERHHPVTRGTLANILWPSCSRESTSHRLRQTLHKLRHVGVPVLASGKLAVALGQCSITTDYDSVSAQQVFQERVAADSLTILPAYEPRFSPVFLEWLDEKRREKYSAFTPMLLDAIKKHRATGEWQRVELFSSALLRISPYNEEATLTLAEAFAMKGAKMEAVRLIDDYLIEAGAGPNDIRLPASLMRKRILDRLPTRPVFLPCESPLVGRGGAMEALAELLALVRAGQGHSCIVRGVAGIGKSRLMAEFSKFAALQGFHIQRVQCRPGDQNRPLSVFVDLVPLLRSMRGAIGCSPDTISHLDRLTKYPAAGGGRIEGSSDADALYARVEQALFDLLDAVSDETPILMLIEDVHWIDRESSKVLHDIIDWCRTRRIFLGFTSREPVSWAEFGGHLHDLPLPPIESAPAREIVQSRVGHHGVEIEASYLDWCIRVAEGNPYFLEELGNHWLETDGQHSAPASLTTLVDQRVSRLGADALQLLQACAILEDHPTFCRIERTLGFEAHRLLTSIGELERAGMAKTRTSAASRVTDSLFPKHELIASAALRELSDGARAYLHRRAASILQEEVASDATTAILWDCAKHWQLSGDSSRAFSLAHSCALHLMEVGLPGAAAEAYEKTLTYCSSPEERLETLVSLARAYHQSSASEAVARTEEAARKLQHLLHPNESPHDEMELMGLRACLRAGNAEQALLRSLVCLAAEDASADHRVKGGSLALMLLDLTCRHDDMAAAFKVIEALANHNGVAIQAVLESRMVYHTVCGDPQKAVEAAEQLVSMQRSTRDRADLFRYLCNASVTYRAVGLFDHSRQCLVEAVSISTSHRSHRSLCRALPMLAHLALERDQLDEATEWFLKVREQPFPKEDTFATFDLKSIGARLALASGDADEASRCYARTFDDILRDAPGPGRTYALALYVAIKLGAREVLSRSVLTALESYHIASRRCLHQAFATYVLTVGLVESGDEKRARSLLSEYQRRYRRERWSAQGLFNRVCQLGTPDSGATLQVLREALFS